MNSTEIDYTAADKLLRDGEFSEAFIEYNKIITQNPNDYRAWVGVGMYMLMTCQFKEAKANFEFIIEQDPSNAVAWYGLAQTLNNLGNKLEACNAIDKASLIAPNNSSVQLFRSVCYAELGATPEQICELFKCWGEMFADPTTDKAPPSPKLEYNLQNVTKRLKIGYVSADLRNHSVAFFMEPVFAHHNTDNHEIYVFNNAKQEDAYTLRMKANVEHWLDIYEKNDTEVYELIQELGIDILVDLSGHTLGNRLPLFAMRPAPVQVTWIGYMYPTGMKAIDYRLTSFALAPTGSEKYYNEKLFRTSMGAMYSPPSNVQVFEDPPLTKNGYPTLISLNHSRKITDHMLVLWKRILNKRPQARLVILTKEISQEKAFENLIPRLETLDMPLDRIHVCKQLPLVEFMTLGEIADLQLDTQPVSGGTTTLHALWMGLPVVAFAGVDAMSISTTDKLTTLGLQDWIVHDDDSYVAKVLDLIDNPEKIIKFRKTCQQSMQSSPFMDYSVSTAELEKSFRLMWINHLLQEKKYLDSRPDIQKIINVLQ